MPSTYAHYRLGQEVYKSVSALARTAIKSHKELFDIGLHGPDILFYYRPLAVCTINKQGYDMHARSGLEFFKRAGEIFCEADEDDKEALLAYIYGYCCHFALDVSCHGYIDEKIAKDGVSHTEIEVEFDRSLMIKDGYDPITHSLTDHIKVNNTNAAYICRFYNYLTKDDIIKALDGMVSYNKLLIAPSRIKRAMIYSLLHITGNYKEMHGLLVNYRANPLCNDSTDKLYELYESAKQLAVTLISEFRASAYGRIEYNKMYNYTFGSKLVEENVHKASETQIKNQTNNNTEDNAKTVIQYTVSNELENNADGDESDNADGSSRKCG